MENRHIEVEWREPDEVHDDHDEEMTITAALDVLDEKEVKLFMELEDWRPRAGDSAMLWARACEIAGSEKCYCSDLQLALRELRGQDPDFACYVKPVEPESQPEQQPAPQAFHLVEKDDEPEPTVEALRRMSDKELQRRATAERLRRRDAVRHIQQLSGEI